MKMLDPGLQSGKTSQEILKFDWLDFSIKMDMINIHTYYIQKE
jgi:hypothetical protein